MSEERTEKTKAIHLVTQYQIAWNIYKQIIFKCTYLSWIAESIWTQMLFNSFKDIYKYILWIFLTNRSPIRSNSNKNEVLSSR
ncbi:MAG: hypothetical protein FWG98_09580 [Candidatus Cloacimonetes bacterium]|nr:hypothetical protein [Candidatus Cloacimonadota bacterium]